MPAFNIVTTTTLLINGSRIPVFQSISIQQSIYDTHRFCITFEHDTVEELRLLFSERIAGFHRKPVEIIIQGDPQTPPFTFNGIITRVALKQQDDGYWGNFVLTGHGHCEELMHVPDTQRFWEMSIAAIVSKTLNEYTYPKKVTVPAGPMGIPYCVRYNETSWDFLKRLAYDFGAWFYYDGTTLLFTNTPGTTPLNLTFGANLTHFQMGVRAEAAYFKHYDYLPTLDKMLLSESPADLPPYNKRPVNGTINPRQAQVDADMRPYMQNRKTALSAESEFMEGKSGIPGLFPGRTITVSDSELGLGGKSAPHIVTSVIHYVTGVGEYVNRFRAIREGAPVMPVRKLNRPVAEPQLGEVVDNKDPKKLGRVKVRLHWMAPDEYTPLLRVVMPHFGTYQDNKKNRGFLFVPEVGDQVMVGFEHNNPERPFVMGTMPHYKNSDVNPREPEEEKHISVSSGSTLTFIERKELKEIHLQVNPENYVKISVPNGPGTITIESSKDILVKAGASITVESPKIKLDGNQVLIKGDDINIEGAKVTLKADSQLAIKGTATDVEGSGTLNVKSSGVTTIKGSMVMIN